MKNLFKKKCHEDWKPYVHTSPSLGFIDSIFILFLLIIGILLVEKIHAQLAYTWNWKFFTDFIIKKNIQGQWIPGLLVSGLIVTTKLGIWSTLLAFIIGACIGIPAAHKKGLSALPSCIYISIVRNIPPLVLLFFLYFFIGAIIPIANFEVMLRTYPVYIQKIIAICFAPIDQIDRMITAIVMLGIYEGAYIAEIVRSGIESVPIEQWEASSALGFSKYTQLRYFILPQAITYMLPSLAGQSISTFKDSALASFISLPELTFQSLETMSISQMTFETWFSTACLYLLLGFTCSQAGKYLEYHSLPLRKTKPML